jgi:hypothetical protein
LSAPRRTTRGILADIHAANLDLKRFAAGAVVMATVPAWEAAWWIWVVAGDPRHAKFLLASSTIASVLAVLMLLHWRPAALVLSFWGLGSAIWLAVARAHPFYVLYALFAGAAGTRGAWQLTRLPKLYAEFVKAWSPHEIVAGDVFTVRDGAEFGVVKVLAVDPGRVHVCQYALRYPERPWQVKTSTMARTKATHGQGSYAHLPLDRAEFARWQPILLRTEPVDASELDVLATWRAVQGNGASSNAG